MLGPTLVLQFVNNLPNVLEGIVLLFADESEIIAPRSTFNDVIQKRFTDQRFLTTCFLNKLKQLA